MPKKAVKSTQDSSKAQQARNPMLAVRLPRSSYRALQRAARAEHRQFPDWFRLNVHKMLQSTTLAAASADTPTVLYVDTETPGIQAVEEAFRTGRFTVSQPVSASAGVARNAESETK